MKKKILFLISNLESGGVSKSMVSLLNTIDRNRYDITLWIAFPHGVFMSQIPDKIKVISDERITALGQNFLGVKHLLAMGCWGLALGSVLRMLLSQVNKSWAALLLAKLMSVIDEQEYDLIVDYNGQQQLYYMVNKLRGKKKVTFFHSDYSKWPYYYRADKRYFPQVDAIFTISPQCVASLEKWFPEVRSKIKLMENVSSPLLIKNLAGRTVKLPWREGSLKLVTVGHVTDTKGSHWAIEAAHLLKERGLDVQWLFIGAVSNRERYNKLVDQWNLKHEILFLGIQSNPYPYIQSADIFVHPSQFEGKSIALDEAKILCKPIVVTNFSTVHDQFENGVNATICAMNPVSIADAIEELVKNEALRNQYTEYLSANLVDNTSEIQKLYNLIEK